MQIVNNGLNKLSYILILTVISVGVVISVLFLRLYNQPEFSNEDHGENKKRSLDVDKEGEIMEYHSMVKDKVLADNIRKNLEHLASVPHIAGSESSKKQAHWVADKFKEFGLDSVDIKKYKALLSYPLGPGKVTIRDENRNILLKFASVEKSYNKYENSPDIVPPYIAYSGSGDIEAELIYVNYGDFTDFRKLKKMGVKVEGNIGLMRYGKIPRSKKIKYAETAKMKGIILFSDPEDYSPTSESYPESWYLPPDGVQRGTSLRMRGDPLSRGYPSLDGYFRRDLKEVQYFPRIPVLPVGYGNAERLMKQLDGLSIPEDRWKGKLNCTYHVTSKSKKIIRIQVDVSREDRPIFNVVGAIRGEIEPDRYIVLGNHRDAWVYGAADPSSGTAVMMEVARALGWLKKKGWKPRRTILICSWDAEEFGLIGSTEWVEEYAKLLSQQAVVYLNVDTAVEGNYTINLKSTAQLVDAFYDSVKRFNDPETSDNLYDTWVEKNRGKHKMEEPDVNLFNQGSDYMAFFADLGIPSLDFRYTFDTSTQHVYNYPVYHTRHDNLDWMTRFIDPDYRYHATIAKIWIQVTLSFADSTILPFNLRRYGDNLMHRCKNLQRSFENLGKPKKMNIGYLVEAGRDFKAATYAFHSRIKETDKNNVLAVRMVNDKLMAFERNFVTSEDIPGEYTTRHIYHSSGVRAALNEVLAERPGALKNFLHKLTLYVYHIRMAETSLNNPFEEKS